MSVVSLNEFREDIERTIEQVRSEGGVSFKSYVQKLEADAQDALCRNLLANIRSGKTHLKSGGEGLERLVAELLELEGYSAKGLAKSTYEGKGDADIKAFREDRLSSNTLLVQVKHHNGTTGVTALRQLQLLNDEDGVQPWIITTGNVAPEMREEAEADGIGVMDGEDFAAWLVEHSHDLSAVTKNRLGLSSVPSLLL